jgi:hypothetical protein
MTFATLDNDEAPVCGNGGEGRGVWFTFQGTGGRISAVSTCQAPIGNISVSIYKGTCGKSTLQCYTDFGSGSCDAAPFTFATVAGTTYYMLLQSTYADTQYIYDLTLVGAPPDIVDNDVCSTATPISIGASIVSNITLATTDENEVTSDCAGGNVTSSQRRGLWFTFQGSGGRIWVNTCASFGGRQMFTAVSVYKGSCGAVTLQCVAGADNPCGGGILSAYQKLSIGTEPGTTYYVLVRNFEYGPSFGQFMLQLTSVLVVVNDVCANATEKCPWAMPAFSPAWTLARLSLQDKDNLHNL